MGAIFNSPLRVNWRTPLASMKIEHQRLTELTFGADDEDFDEKEADREESLRRVIEEIKEQVPLMRRGRRGEPAAKIRKEMLRLRRGITKWLRGGMKEGFKINRNEFSIGVIIETLKRLKKDQKIVANWRGSSYLISEGFMTRLLGVVRPGAGIETSDENFLEFDVGSEDPIITLEKFVPVKAERKNGAFFKWLSTHKYPLKRQQIFTKLSQVSNIKENCLITALINGGLKKKDVLRAKTLIKTRNVPRKDIKLLADALNIRITIKNVRADNDVRNVDFNGLEGDDEVKEGKEAKEAKEVRTFNLGVIENHYFLIEPCTITSYAFKNNLDFADWNKVNKKNRRNNKFINTFTAVKLLIAGGFIKELQIGKSLFQTTFSSGIGVFESLEYSKRELRPITGKSELIARMRNKKESGKAEDFDAVFEQVSEERRHEYETANVEFFDFETSISGRIHKPFLCCSISRDGDEHQFIGEDCGLGLLRYLCDRYGAAAIKKGEGKPKVEQVVLYAHNAGYDYLFELKYLKAKKLIRQGSNLLVYNGLFSYHGKTIEVIIRDTYKLISKPLRDFGRCFSLDQKKEVMPYSLQTDENIAERYLTRETVMEAPELKDEEFHKTFWANCEEWGCYDEELGFDLIDYAMAYCERDCAVLRDGFNIFNQWMIEATGLSIFSHLTIPSLVHEFFITQGCYKDVFECSGVVRAFIQKCVVGGRTMLRNNQKCRVEGQIADFDAVSLYPSAMARMAGFLKGRPKVLTERQLNYNFLSHQDGYFVKINITKVGIRRAFPLMSEMRDGVRSFVNENLRDLYIDKVGLEDLIRFQEVEFDVLQGYYFNSGRNDTIKTVITGLFEERLKKKKEKNPIQEIYKLIMNSSYGKTLLKPIDHTDKIVSSKAECMRYVSTNFHKVEHFTKIYGCDKWIIRSVTPISNHYSIPQVGVEILSMSKRIMNEVMCLSEDNGIDIFYQDTDSLHIVQTSLERLRYLFRDKYDRDLVGKKMGQFHSDFEMRGCESVHSKLFIGLGKKCYIDILEGVREGDGEKQTDYHMRMKAVPSSCLPYTAKKHYDGDVVKMYEAMYKGDSVSFDLLEGGAKCSFQKHKNMTIGNRLEFVRKLSFV